MFIFPICQCLLHLAVYFEVIVVKYVNNAAITLSNETNRNISQGCGISIGPSSNFSVLTPSTFIVLFLSTWCSKPD
jgi:hypothetical protein